MTVININLCVSVGEPNVKHGIVSSQGRSLFGRIPFVFGTNSSNWLELDALNTYTYHYCSRLDELSLERKQRLVNVVLADLEDTAGDVLTDFIYDDTKIETVLVVKIRK